MRYVTQNSTCLAHRLTGTLDSGANGAARQEATLATEGVEVGRGSLGERTVDFSVYGWFPDRLPSEEDESEGDEE